MSLTDDRFSGQVEVLMDIAASLADFTLFPERCTEISAYLCRSLNLDALTLAVIRQAADDAEPQILCSSFSPALAVGDAPLNLHPLLLSIFSQVKDRARQNGQRNGFPAKTFGDLVSELELPQVSAFPRAIVFTRVLDANHLMLLVVHQHVADAPLSPVLTANLNMISHELAKQMFCLITWQNSPHALGQPFDQLTDREWVVLRGMNSDAGEKQLADQLGLSPHTLHSHIKSIYRKIGVQGRLPLLLRLHAALRSLRLRILNLQAQPKLTSDSHQQCSAS